MVQAWRDICFIPPHQPSTKEGPKSTPLHGYATPTMQSAIPPLMRNQARNVPPHPLKFMLDKSDKDLIIKNLRKLKDADKE